MRPLSDFPALPNAVKRWVVPDTNAVLHQFDVLSSPAFPLPLLVPQTVLDEVRHRSLPLFNKLKALIDEPMSGQDERQGVKRGWIVWNEAVDELYVIRGKDESPNDRNDRGASLVARPRGGRLTVCAKLSVTSPLTTPRCSPSQLARASPTNR